MFFVGGADGLGLTALFKADLTLALGKMILPHALRMAETRAINRALRLYTDIGMCSVDELTDLKSVAKAEVAQPKKTYPEAKPESMPKQDLYRCSSCIRIRCGLDSST